MGSKGSPRRGANRLANWSHEKVPAESSVYGWIAGDVHWVDCHPSKASKPCWKLYCGEAYECDGCAKCWRIESLGYVPIYRHDGLQIFVIVYEHQEERVASLKLHTPVCITRAKGKGESCCIAKTDKLREWHTALPERLRPVDIIPALCRVWKSPGFEPTLRAALSANDNALSLPPVPPPVDPVAELAKIDQDHAEQQRAVIRRHIKVRPSEPATFAESMPNYAARNGKPKT